jgi:hypothetical protein
MELMDERGERRREEGEERRVYKGPDLKLGEGRLTRLC